MRVIFNLNVELADTSISYLDACARIRQMPKTRLISRMIGTICNDQLVLAILDDDSKPCILSGEKRAYHHRHVNKSK